MTTKRKDKRRKIVQNIVLSIGAWNNRALLDNFLLYLKSILLILFRIFYSDKKDDLNLLSELNKIEKKKKNHFRSAQSFKFTWYDFK